MATPASSMQRRANCLWPLLRGTRGYIRGTLIDRYRAAVHNLLRTPKGSLIWLPEYGLELEKYRNRSLSEDANGDISFLRAEIEQALQRWVPDVIVLHVDAETDSSNDERLLIHVTWGLPQASGVGSPLTTRDYLAAGPIQQSVLV